MKKYFCLVAMVAALLMAASADAGVPIVVTTYQVESRPVVVAAPLAVVTVRFATAPVRLHRRNVAARYNARQAANEALNAALAEAAK